MKNLFVALLIIISCRTENELYNVPQKWELTEATGIKPDFSPDFQNDSEKIDTGLDLVPDIQIDHVEIGSMEVRQSCQSTGKFSIKNVGSADLIINDLGFYITMPPDGMMTSGPIGMPLSLAPGSEQLIDFEINQSDDINDSIMLVAKSNDPDEPVASKDVTYTSTLGARHAEYFTITEGKEADILMIVDNSCSMREEQTTLSSNSELFINALDYSGVDYRIAVITTDSPTFIGPVIVPTLPDPAMELSNQVNVGIVGSPNEKGLLMASLALSPAGMASPGGAFLRRDARLSLVWISDEDDFSGGTTYTWSSDFWSKKSSPGDVSVWGIIGDPIYGCGAAYPGDIYNDLLIAMGGSWTSICSTDWGTPLLGVASRVGIDATLELAGNPIPSSIRVFVNSTRSYEWVYVTSTNAVSFNPGHTPVVGSSITIDYAEVGDCD